MSGLAKLLGISDDVYAALMSGADHGCECRCDICLTMWALTGPDTSEPYFGPFSMDEVVARAKELGKDVSHWREVIPHDSVA